VNGFPVTVQARGAALMAAPGRRACGWARSGPAKAPQEMNDPAASRGGRAQPRSRVAREFRPGTGRGAWLPGDGACVRVRAEPGAAPGQGSRRARCPEGSELAVLPGLEPHRGGLPAAGAGDSGDAVAGQAAGRQQSAQQAADDVRELPRTPARDQRGAAVIFPAPGPGPAGHADLADGLLTASQGDRPPCAR
jgi:hypothetical protein